jgi:2-keto-4-pentenoate hydratase/2-oxohepta-3-ene-1,7-dioic acid hydratase in catechol pathway
VSLHYEVELALIMGREVRDLREEDEEAALGAIECTFSFPYRRKEG